MTVDEIDRAAFQNQELPDNLSQPRQLLFLSLRRLYRDFRDKTLEQEKAHKEKIKILETYKGEELSHRIYTETAEMRNRLSQYCTVIEKSGCDKCKLAVKIFDGREK